MKFAKTLLLILVLGSLYLLAMHRHAQREDIRNAAVALTPDCAAKLARYALESGEEYR